MIDLGSMNHYCTQFVAFLALIGLLTLISCSFRLLIRIATEFIRVLSERKNSIVKFGLCLNDNQLSIFEEKVKKPQRKYTKSRL